MPLVTIIVVLIVIGIVLWLINTYLPMDTAIKKILNIVVIVAVVLWLLSLVVGFGSLNSIRIGG